MKIEMEIEEKEIDWEDNAFLKIMQSSKSLISIEANKEGLISLAKQFLTVAYSKENLFIHHWPEKTTEKGYSYGDLEEDSIELVVLKVERSGRKKP